MSVFKIAKTSGLLAKQIVRNFKNQNVPSYLGMVCITHLLARRLYMNQRVTGSKTAETGLMQSIPSQIRCIWKSPG